METLVPIGVLGSGYLGKALLKKYAWPDPSWYSTLLDTPSGIESLNYPPVSFDWADQSTWPNLPDKPVVIVLTIPPVLLDTAEESVRVEAWCRWMNLHRPYINHLVYISSTGVYPNISQLWSEEDNVNPDTRNGQLRWRTERVLEKFFHVNVIRSGAIYGPMRHIGIRLQKGKPIPHGQQPVHRVHIEDLAAIIFEAIHCTDFPSIVNAVDHNSDPSVKVSHWLLDQPWFESDGTQIVMDEDYQSRKHQAVSTGRLISNDRLTRVFGYKFQYPTYKEGLKQAVSSSTR